MNYTLSWNGRLKFMSMVLSCICCLWLTDSVSHYSHTKSTISIPTYYLYYIHQFNANVLNFRSRFLHKTSRMRGRIVYIY